jgi:hypothetical protein
MNKLIEQDNYLAFLSEEIKYELTRISENSPRFLEWFKLNILKIKSKMKNSKEIEDIFDIVAELKGGAYLLRSAEISILEYEPHHQEKQAPDFKVIIKGKEVYIEVKRLRMTNTEIYMQEFMNQFRNRIKEISRNYGVSLIINDLNTDEAADQDIYLSLLNNVEAIIQNIDELMSTLPDEVDDYELKLDNFADGLVISISSVPVRRRENKVHNYGSSFRIPYTGKEYRKFGDVITDKINQLIDGERNIIFLISDNNTHEFEDLEDGITSVNRLIKLQNDSFFINKGYEGINDFQNKSKRLSGILFSNNRREDKFWLNKSASVIIDEDIVNTLKEIRNH